MSKSGVSKETSEAIALFMRAVSNLKQNNILVDYKLIYFSLEEKICQVIGGNVVDIDGIKNQMEGFSK